MDGEAAHALPAIHTDAKMPRSVELDDPLRIVPGFLVQAVGVLRNQKGKFSRLGEAGQGPVSPGGFRAQDAGVGVPRGGPIAPADLPGGPPAPDVEIPGVEPIPDSAPRPEIGNPAFGTDPRAGKATGSLRAANPPRGTGVEVI